MSDVTSVLTLPVFATASGTPITAPHYAAAVAIAEAYNLGKVYKRPIAHRPAWRVQDYHVNRRRAGKGGFTTFNTYTTPPKPVIDADAVLEIYNITE